MAQAACARAIAKIGVSAGYFESSNGSDAGGAWRRSRQPWGRFYLRRETRALPEARESTLRLPHYSLRHGLCLLQGLFAGQQLLGHGTGDGRGARIAGALRRAEMARMLIAPCGN